MRFNRLDLNLLVALDALLAERSVTRAAAVLNLSPSATSDALSRLREYFGDDLLVQVGRRMEPTPRAEWLQPAVRDILVRVDSTITAQPNFDPSISDRVFRIFASDYTQMVLGPPLMTALSEAKCLASISILPQVLAPQRDLERGEADLLVLPHEFMTEDHPYELLYQERFVCVTWKYSEIAKGKLTLSRYQQSAHVLMKPIALGSDSFQEAFLKRSSISRHVAATSYGFATVAPLLIGTEYVATLHERLARILSKAWPLAIRPCPFEIPPMQQAMQWHKHRTQDPGLAWLRGQFRKAALAVD